MPRIVSRQEIEEATGEPVWLVELEIGSMRRYATAQVTITSDATGLTYRYSPGLLDVDAAALGEDLETLDLAIQDPSLDVGAIVARGHQLEQARARVLRWWPGTPYEAAAVIIEGPATNASWGARGALLVLTVESWLITDSTTLLDPLAVADLTSWPTDQLTRTGATANSLPTEVYGRPYPIVIGAPGHAPDLTAPARGTPAYIVQVKGTPDTNTYFLIAGHAVSAGDVVLYAEDEQAREDPSASPVVQTVQDGRGRTVSVIEYGDMTISWGSLQGTKKIWVGWQHGSTYGAGMVGTDGLAIRTLRDAMLWFMRRSRVPYDAQAIAAANWLGAYQMDTYYNDPKTTIRDWREALTDLIPMQWVHGPDGVYPVRVQWSPTPQDVRHVLTEGREVNRISEVTALKQPIYNEITVRYRGGMGGAQWLASRSVTGTAGRLSSIYEISDDQAMAHAACLESQVRYGVRQKTIDLEWVWDHATAVRIAHDLADRYALPHYACRYLAPPWAESIAPWSVVRLVDAGLSVDRLALVQSRIPVPGGVQLDLIILDALAGWTRATE